MAEIPEGSNPTRDILLILEHLADVFELAQGPNVKSALEKLRSSERLHPGAEGDYALPEGAVTPVLMLAGSRGSTPMLQWHWLSEPLTAVEAAAVRQVAWRVLHTAPTRRAP